jgi:hypothetical protein
MAYTSCAGVLINNGAELRNIQLDLESLHMSAIFVHCTVHRNNSMKLERMIEIYKN